MLTLSQSLLAQAYSVIDTIAASLIAELSGASYAAFVAVRKLKIQFGFKSTIGIYLISALTIDILKSNHITEIFTYGEDFDHIDGITRIPKLT